MNKAFTKWIILLVAGAAVLAFTAWSFAQKNYTWVMAGLFVGLFLTTTAWKRISFLAKGEKAAAAGRKEIVISYRDKNLKESETAVIPAGADMMFFYGFEPNQKTIKVFRWELIRQALEDGKNIQKEDILERISAR